MSAITTPAPIIASAGACVAAIATASAKATIAADTVVQDSVDCCRGDRTYADSASSAGSAVTSPASKANIDPIAAIAALTS